MAKPLPSTNPPQPAAKPPAKSVAQRRGFMTGAGAIVLGGIAGLVPVLSGLAVFFDPLRRRNRASKFLRVASLDALPDDGVPRQFPVIAERVDAWNRSVEPIGAVYLRRGPGQEKPECLTATCPHAGCFVDYDADSKTFKCPCHNSSFEPDGKVIEPSPSPRAMDTLECEINDQEILVKFQAFYSGKAEKVVKE
jgi:menaquinol-cytochrome c reductase iron-sulfur subunit